MRTTLLIILSTVGMSFTLQEIEICASASGRLSVDGQNGVQLSTVYRQVYLAFKPEFFLWMIHFKMPSVFHVFREGEVSVRAAVPKCFHSNRCGAEL